jgi:Protein of unknown function (DUF1592)/Protein of unknown function (DUF1588)/Protein of unknown function (DUF1595)/Protein of unknown function (DUF1587)
MMSHRATSCFSIPALLVVAACTGQIGERHGVAGAGNPNDTSGTGSSGTGSSGTGSSGTGNPGNPTGGPGDPGMPDACKPNASFASARVSLISDEQYVNVVRDVFGIAFEGDVTAPKSTSGEYGFNAQEVATVGSTTAQAYLRAADQIAAKIQPCGAAAVTAACMEPYLRNKLPLAWRRPVTDAEIGGLMTVFNAGWTDGAARAVQLTMEAALGSPAFLYRTEVGKNAATATGNVALTSHELASAVSFALTNSSPDGELRARADDGTLATASVLEAEVDRVMALPAARDNLKKKISYYLNFEKVPLITKDVGLFKEFTPSLRASVYQSAEKLLDDVLWSGRFADLFASTRVYANAEMAGVYGLPTVSGTALGAVDGVAAGYTAGLLTHPALLLSSNKHAGTDDIVHRGLWVYENLVCGVSIGAPPANADAVFATFTGTEREKALKRDALSCGACHASFDPFGLVTENFDPIGRHRAIDPETQGPVDTSATVVRIGADLDGPVRDVNDVAARLAMGRRASDCAVVHLAKFTLDHNPDVENSCLIQKVKDDFAKSGSFPALFKAILTSPAFLTRDL